MEKDQIILLEDRGLILITGEDVKNFGRNFFIFTSDIWRSFNCRIIWAVYGHSAKVVHNKKAQTKS